MNAVAINLDVELTEQQAWDFAQFLKRVAWSDFRDLSATDDEAYRMQEAALKFQQALEEQGFSPR